MLRHKCLNISQRINSRDIAAGPELVSLAYMMLVCRSANCVNKTELRKLYRTIEETVYVAVRLGYSHKLGVRTARFKIESGNFNNNKYMVIRELSLMIA